MKKNININEHISEIMFRSKYRINESAKYHKIIDNNEEFDEFPKEISEEDEIPPIGKEPNKPIEEPATADLPPIDSNLPIAGTSDTPEMSPLDNSLAPNQIPMEDQVTVDDIQNDIIKTNLETLKHLNQQLKSIDDYIKGIDNKIASLNADVEEVRAPTNGEKLMKQKNVSYPYYYNLNDYWDGNNFEHKREEENFGQGIKKLDNGTFIADFDDLPKNIGNLDKSFTDY